jgi:hypothetical protein
MTQSCRSCLHFDIDRVKNAAGAVLTRRAAPCRWVSTEIYPTSVNRSVNSRPQPGSMCANDGADCKCYTARPS